MDVIPDPCDFDGASEFSDTDDDYIDIDEDEDDEDNQSHHEGHKLHCRMSDEDIRFKGIKIIKNIDLLQCNSRFCPNNNRCFQVYFKKCSKVIP